ncbi:unnamed protein product [Heterobilharzia americana]|nr:unnamed protein product [Heterobilharzia americana]
MLTGPNLRLKLTALAYGDHNTVLIFFNEIIVSNLSPALNSKPILMLDGWKLSICTNQLKPKDIAIKWEEVMTKNILAALKNTKKNTTNMALRKGKRTITKKGQVQENALDHRKLILLILIQIILLAILVCLLI